MRVTIGDPLPPGHPFYSGGSFIVSPVSPTPAVATSEVDIRLLNEGMLTILWGVTDEGAGWLAENLDPSGKRWGSGYVVEHRYVGDILEGVREDGLVLGRFS